MSKDEKYYYEVVDKISESLDLYSKYEVSYKVFMASQPNPDLDKKVAEEKNVKEALAKQLKQEEELQKQEAEAIAKAEEAKLKKELRSNVIKRENAFRYAFGKFQSVKKYSDEMIQFTRGLSREQVVNQVLEFAHVRSLPTYETKNMLLDRFEIARNAAEAFEDAVFAESRTDVKAKVEFDGVAEDASVQDTISMLSLLLNAKVEYNGKGSVSSQPSTARSTPIKVKLNTPKFSGRSRDFAIFKKEFMDVIVPGRSDPEIGALLREGLNTKEKDLLRNNDLANYMGALDILQNEYGKPHMVISDVNVELDKLKPPTGEKADQGFIALVETVENICRDMETVSRSGDLKNGHMINVPVRKWEEHN